MNKRRGYFKKKEIDHVYHPSHAIFLFAVVFMDVTFTYPRLASAPITVPVQPFPCRMSLFLVVLLRIWC